MREKRAKPPGWAGGFELDKAENLPEVSLESVQRDDVYADVLKQARVTRPEEKRGEEISSEQEAKAKKPVGSRPASAKTSPLPSYILDLMYGPEDVATNNELGQEKKSQQSVD